MRGAWYVVSLALRRLRRRRRRRSGRRSGSRAAAVCSPHPRSHRREGPSVAQDVERLPAAAGRSGRRGSAPAGREEQWASLDREARKALSPLPGRADRPSRSSARSTIGGVFVGLAAVDGLAPHVVLRSGRLPRACAPERCEVLRLRGVGSLPDVPGLRVVQVGTAALRSRQLFGTSSRRRTTRSPTPHSPRRSPRRRGTTAPSRGRSSWPKASPASPPPRPRPLVPQLQLGSAAGRGDTAAVGDRRARGGRRPRQGRAPVEFRVVALAPVAGARGRGARRDGRGPSPAARRRRGGRPPGRVRDLPRARCGATSPLPGDA